MTPTCGYTTCASWQPGRSNRTSAQSAKALTGGCCVWSATGTTKYLILGTTKYRAVPKMRRIRAPISAWQKPSNPLLWFLWTFAMCAKRLPTTRLQMDSVILAARRSSYTRRACSNMAKIHKLNGRYLRWRQFPACLQTCPANKAEQSKERR